MTRRIYRETTTTTVREIIEDTPDQPSSFFAQLRGDYPPAPQIVDEHARSVALGQVAIRGWCQHTRQPINFIGKLQRDHSLLIEKIALVSTAIPNGARQMGHSTGQDFEGQIWVGADIYCGACFKSSNLARCRCGVFSCHLIGSDKLFCVACGFTGGTCVVDKHRATLYADSLTPAYQQPRVTGPWGGQSPALLAPRGSVPQVGHTPPRQIGHGGHGQRALPAPKPGPLMLGHDGGQSAWDNGGNDDTF